MRGMTNNLDKRINYKLLNQMLQDELFNALEAELTELLKDDLAPCDAMKLNQILGEVLSNLGKYTQSLTASKKSLNICVTQNDIENIAKTYSNLIVILAHLNRYEEATYCAKLSIYYYKQFNLTIELAHAYNNLAYVYKKQEKYIEAIEVFYRTSLLECIENDVKLYLTIHCNLATLYLITKNYPMFQKQLHILEPKVQEADLFTLNVFFNRLKACLYYYQDDSINYQKSLATISHLNSYLTIISGEARFYSFLLTIATDKKNEDDIKLFSEKYAAAEALYNEQKST